MKRVTLYARGWLPFKLSMAALWLLLAMPAAATANGIDWQPQRTWVFVVGTLEWKDKESFSSFPKENRRDRELVRFFRQKGVPDSQIVYLQDREATTRRIRQSLLSLLAKTKEGDTLFLYYTGHGYKTDDGHAYFASYDADDEGNPGWAVDSIPIMIERYFKGSRAFLAADCCFSGALMQSVRKRQSEISYAVFTSATSDRTSTGNWTFTEALLAGLRGRSYIDTDGNREITLSELGREIKSDMSFAEEQTASFLLTGDFDVQTILSEAEARPDKRVGARVVVYSEGDWYKARIIDAARGRYRVHYYGYEDEDDEWIKPSQIRGNRSRTFLGRSVGTNYSPTASQF
jgi:hypothetical protein